MKLKIQGAIRQFDKSMSPVIQTCFHTRAPHFGLGMHHHEYYQLIYITRGTLKIVADKEYICHEGDIIILPPALPHTLSSDTGYSQIGIDFRKCTDSDNPHHPLATAENTYHSSAPRFLDMANDIAKWIDSFSIHSDNILKNYVNLFMLLVANRQVNHQSSHFGTRLSDYLDQNLDNENSVDEISAALSVSTSHLQRLCREHFGVGVKTLFNKKRFAKACSLLTDTQMSAKEIGEAIGFSSAANFSAFFKKHSGVTPATYRKNNFM